MIFDPVDMLSWPGKLGRPNEDAFAHADRLVAVFDGATMIADPVLHADSDAAWIARKGAEGVIRNDVAGLTAKDILKLTAQMVHRDYLAQRFRAPVANYENPFAAMMLLRLTGNEMDALWFGDCAALVKPPDGETFVIGETLELRAGEAEKAKSLSADGQIRTPEIIDALRAGRDRLNNGGKWVFGTDPVCVDHVSARRVTVSAGTEILVASDGVFALISDYGRYTPETLMAAIISKGLKALFTELREVENADADCKRFPRFKTSDDATAILLRVA
jgi:hypothetical protein